MEWRAINAGIQEWVERNSYRPPELQEDNIFVAQNVGWGAGIRADWNASVVAEVLLDGRTRGEWPTGLAVSDFWEGFGIGWGRAYSDVPARADTLPQAIPEEARAAVVRGMQVGRARGEVPEAPRKPTFASVRGPAT